MKIKKLIAQNREIISYLIVGLLTTLVSLSTYFICTHTFLNPENAFEIQIANLISWFFSVTFAYITNRIFVFKSQSKNYIKEIFSFFTSRMATLLMDMGIMFFIVTLMHCNDGIGKLISQVVVIVANYVLSKVFVFKGEKTK